MSDEQRPPKRPIREVQLKLKESQAAATSKKPKKAVGSVSKDDITALREKNRLIDENSGRPASADQVMQMLERMLKTQEVQVKREKARDERLKKIDGSLKSIDERLSKLEKSAESTAIQDGLSQLSTDVQELKKARGLAGDDQSEDEHTNSMQWFVISGVDI